jgi:hypothetical protein
LVHMIICRRNVFSFGTEICGLHQVKFCMHLAYMYMYLHAFACICKLPKADAIYGLP